MVVPSEFFFESEFHDEKENPKEQESKEPTKNSSRAKSKNKKRNNGTEASKPHAENTTGDLLGLDLSGGDESDALLLELASLDFGHPLPTEVGADTDEPLLGAGQPAETFKADFERVFGSDELTSKDDWNQLLPSHFLSSSQYASSSDSSLLSFDPPAAPAASLPTKPENAPKKVEANPPKKVLQNVFSLYFRGFTLSFLGQATGGKDMSSWYNLFADLDPLGNPDALSSTKKEEDDRNC